MAKINIMHVRSHVSTGGLAKLVTPEAVRTVIGRYGFKEVNQVVGATIHVHPDDNDFDYCIVVPEQHAHDWHLRLDEAIGAAAYVSHKTELEVFRDLLQESGHEVSCDD